MGFLTVQLRDQVDKMTVDMSKMKESLTEKETTNFELRDKLQVSYKDYLALLGDFEALKSNTSNAKELQLAQQRIDSITSQHQSLSRDLILANQTSEERKSKCAQYEFQLEELTRQFNQTGAEKTQLTTNFKELQQRFTATSKELTDLKKAHTILLQQKASLDSDLRALTATHEQLKVHSTAEIEERDQTIAKQKEEFDKLTKTQDRTLEELRIAKATIQDLEVELLAVKTSSNNTITNLNMVIQKDEKKIADLLQSDDENRRTVQKLKTERETLIMKLNDLKQAFDMEVTRNKSMMVEMKEFRADVEQREHNMDEAQRKLEKQRELLTNEKIQLVEQVRDLKTSLEDQQQRFVDLEALLEHERQNWADSEDKFKVEYCELKDNYDSTCSRLATLKEEYKKTSEALTRTKAQSNVIVTELEEKLSTLTKEHDTIVSAHIVLKSKEADESASLDAATKELTHLRADHERVTKEHKILKLESGEEIRVQSHKIKDLENKVKTLSNRVATLEETKSSLTTKLAKTKEELEMTFAKYMEEKRLREVVDTGLDSTIKTMMEERGLRQDAQNLLFRSDREEKEAQKLAIKEISERRRKAAKVWNSLQDEYSRLRTFLEATPEEKMFAIDKLPYKS